MNKFTVKIDDSLTADEIVKLRLDSGWDGDILEWQKCLKQYMVCVSARNSEGKLVGVGFISGSKRHAELVDLVVSPDCREQGIGSQILSILCNYAKEEQIKYFGLTYDENFPWLKEFYEKYDFMPVSFAMWHKDSLNYKRR